jgi:hypothetical protein
MNIDIFSIIHKYLDLDSRLYLEKKFDFKKRYKLPIQDDSSKLLIIYQKYGNIPHIFTFTCRRSGNLNFFASR